MTVKSLVKKQSIINSYFRFYSMFYMAVRYESLESYTDLELTELMPIRGDKEPINGEQHGV